jgi:hypothetical protein
VALSDIIHSKEEVLLITLLSSRSGWFSTVLTMPFSSEFKEMLFLSLTTNTISTRVRSSCTSQCLVASGEPVARCVIFRSRPETGLQKPSAPTKFSIELSVLQNNGVRVYGAWSFPSSSLSSLVSVLASTSELLDIDQLPDESVERGSVEAVETLSPQLLLGAISIPETTSFSITSDVINSSPIISMHCWPFPATDDLAMGTIVGVSIVGVPIVDVPIVNWYRKW